MKRLEPSQFQRVDSGNRENSTHFSLALSAHGKAVLRMPHSTRTTILSSTMPVVELGKLKLNIFQKKAI